VNWEGRNVLQNQRQVAARETFPPVTAGWFLTGPTASGKSAIALELAQRFNAEIVSVDSMAVFRGLDIGTAKPALADRERVPHHLLDIVDPNLEFSLAEFVEAAHLAAADIASRGRQPLFVGGTPLYLKSLLRGLYQGPPPDWEFRKQVEEEVRTVGLEALRMRLQQVDPLTAHKLHPHDQRRMIRALEVHKATGIPLSHQQTQFDETPWVGRQAVVAIEWARPMLHSRIEQRVDAMFERGLIEETRAVLAKFGGLSRTSSQAVGYREVIEHLAGGCDVPTTIERVKAATRQFARRQETWFRGLVECQRLPLDASTDPQLEADRIARYFTGGSL
jgi:tRNA dimethylallyltransferase